MNGKNHNNYRNSITKSQVQNCTNMDNLKYSCFNKTKDIKYIFLIVQ